MQGSPATLHDGTVVDSYSEEWRAECEARAVLRLPTKSRRHAYLDSVESKRGRKARRDLENLVMTVWRAGRGQ